MPFKSVKKIKSSDLYDMGFCQLFYKTGSRLICSFSNKRQLLLKSTPTNCAEMEKENMLVIWLHSHMFLLLPDKLIHVVRPRFYLN